MVNLSQQWKNLYRRFRNDILFFAEKVCHIKPTDQQREILLCIQNEVVRPPGWKVKKKIAIKSGQGCGKTALTALAVTWLTLRWKGAITYVTSPAMHHAKQVWLAEYRRTLAKAHPLLRAFIEVTKTSVTFGSSNPDWAVKLVTASKIEAIAGRHAKHQYIVIEEATGIENEIWETLIGTQTGDDALTIAISNPTTAQCDFGYAFFRNRRLWHLFTIDGEKCPLVSKSHIREMLETYGRDSNAYKIRVLGEFPDKDPDVLIDPQWIYKAFQTPLDLAIETGGYTKAFGIDFARKGGDECVAVQRYGWAVINLWSKSMVEPSEPLHRAWEWQLESKWSESECIYIVDATGIGQGQIENARSGGRIVHEFHNHGVPSQRMFANKVSEAYWEFAQLLKEGVVHLPEDMRLMDQLAGRKYYYDKKGRIALESKDDFKRRVGESPDRADAVVMAFYRHHTVKGLTENLDLHRKVGLPYDSETE